MQNVTREGDWNTYYMYKDFFITRERSNGYYVTHSPDGVLKADTQRGIKKLINEYIKPL